MCPTCSKPLEIVFQILALDGKGRCLQRNGQKIIWKTIVRLYYAKKDKILKRSYKLNPQNVFLNSFSCMKVAFAAQVFSRTVANDLEVFNWPNTSETVKFIRCVNDVFDCLNGAHSLHGRKTNNPHLEPYRTVNDERFQFLMSFLDYLEKWRVESELLENFSFASDPFSQPCSQGTGNNEEDYDVLEEISKEEQTPAKKKQLSQQTIEGLDISIMGFLGVTRFVLRVGTGWVNARVFCQDPLEQYFRCGGSTNPNLGQYLLNQKAIPIEGQLGVKRQKGNTEAGVSSMTITNEPRKGKKDDASD